MRGRRRGRDRSGWREGGTREGWDLGGRWARQLLQQFAEGAKARRLRSGTKWLLLHPMGSVISVQMLHSFQTLACENMHCNCKMLLIPLLGSEPCPWLPNSASVLHRGLIVQDASHNLLPALHS